MLETFADYLTIEPGDRIFFFQDRRIFGVGRVLDPTGTGQGCFWNYPSACQAKPPEPDPALAVIGPSDPEWKRIRAAVPFVGEPQFFSEGLDMDEVLAADGSEAAWGLRFWLGYSFQQLGERETQLLVDAFQRRFANEAGGPRRFRVDADDAGIPERITRLSSAPVSMTDIVTANPDDYVRADGSVCFEATLHGLLIEACRAASTTQSPLVNDLRLDVFHELAASPPKPPTYADRMDVVATRRFPTESRINGRAVHFDIVEAKRDALSGHAQKYDRSVAQLMKYVDFVAMHHAGGNYAAISAFFVAHSFSDAVIRRYEESLREELGVVGRSYVLNPRDDPATRLWREMKLLKYSWSPVVGRLELHAVF